MNSIVIRSLADLPDSVFKAIEQLSISSNTTTKRLSQGIGWYWVLYDISSSKMRNKLIVLLEYYGCKRVQYSVFVGLVSKLHVEQLKQTIEGWQNTSQTRISVIILPIPLDVASKLWCVGVTQEVDSWCTHQHTHFI